VCVSQGNQEQDNMRDEVFIWISVKRSQDAELPRVRRGSNFRVELFLRPEALDTMISFGV
jgi:hypothetical protein